jgi:DNA-binding NarL/FixJ family response regulator
MKKVLLFVAEGLCGAITDTLAVRPDLVPLNCSQDLDNFYELVQQHKPELVIMDTPYFGDLLAKFSAYHLAGVKQILLLAEVDENIVKEAVLSGILGIILTKQINILPEVIEAVERGSVFLGAGILPGNLSYLTRSPHF